LSALSGRFNNLAGYFFCPEFYEVFLQATRIFDYINDHSDCNSLYF